MRIKVNKFPTKKTHQGKTKKSKETKVPTKKTKSNKTPTKTTKKTRTSTRGSFDSVLQKSHEVPVVIQFFTNWCGPCRTLKPVMEKLAKQAGGKWLLAMVDVEKNPQIASQYGIRSIPDVHLFHKGQSIASFKGAKPEHIIQNWLDSNLPKRRRRGEYSEADDLLKKGNVGSAITQLLQMLLSQNPDSPLIKLILALQSMGKNNPQAMQLINEIERKGGQGALAKRIRDLIDMDIDEKDAHTPTHSPYNPAPTSANAKIDLNNFSKSLLAQLVQDMVNEVRRSRGVQSLNEDTVLAAAANDQNVYQMKHDVLSHHQNNNHKHTVQQRVDSFGGGFRTVGENVQYQGMQVTEWNNRIEIIMDTYVNTARKMVENWINSPGHYKNMINPRFTYVGTSVGWNPENNAFFATQVFGG